MNNEEKIYLKDFLKTILKKWYIVVLSIIVFISGATIISSLRTDCIYQAQASAYIYNLPKDKQQEYDHYTNSNILENCKNRMYRTSFTETINEALSNNGFSGLQGNAITVSGNGNFTFYFTVISDDAEKSAAAANLSMQEVTKIINGNYQALILYPVQKAAVNDIPHKPDMLINQMFSAIAGAIFGIGFVYSIEYFKNRSGKIKNKVGTEHNEK